MRPVLAIILCFTVSLLMAQNTPPTVTITNVDLDEGAGTVSIEYDLDSPGNFCTVYFRASMDDGTTFLETAANVSGDIGPGISGGPGKSILWAYGSIMNIHAATVQVIADDGTTPDIQSMVDQVNTQELAERLAQVAIPRHHSNAPQGLQTVRDTMYNTFERLGLHTSTHVAVFQGTPADNILGRHTGLAEPSRTYIVDGHYDAVVNTPGADDNATAVVATMEIARILSQYRFRNSLRFIGFAFEEQGLIGSQQYVQNGIPAWEEVHGVLNMEMIGYFSDEPNSQTMPPGFELLFPAATAELAANENRGDFLTVVGNTASNDLNTAFLSACDQYVPELKRIPLSVPGNGEIAPDLRRSDHAPFWDTGVQALMLTDGSNYRNPHYHLPSDAVGTIDMAFFTNCTKAVLAAAAMLAEPMNAGMDSFALSTLVDIHEHHHTFPCQADVQPNPAHGHLYIKLGDCAGERIIAELFDMRGTKVTGTVLTANTGTELHEMPITGIAAGIYLLVLRTGESSSTIKVEIE